MTDYLSKAITFATEAHSGQVDKLNEPYIGHPLRVMMKVWDDPKARILAVLHDTLEDTDLSFEVLQRAGFDNDILDALLAITRLPNEGYQSFIVEVSKNELATKVKFADIADNLDPSRMGRIESKTAERLVAKYLDAIDILSEAEDRRIEVENLREIEERNLQKD